MGELKVGRITQFEAGAAAAAIRAHWDQRASLGEKAGSDDLIAKQLEQRAILDQLGWVGFENGRGLEIGCGRGETAVAVALRYRAKQILAVDYSPAMIAEARVASLDAIPNLTFKVGDVLDPPKGPFDVIYTQRCLINLPSWELQKQAIDAIADRLVSGGRFLMCENSQEGLDAINERRVSLGLPAIQHPWHNRYLRQHELSTITSLRLREVIPFSAAYYYNSRIANAYHAQAAGTAPDYNAPINRMALHQPASDVNPRFAQGRLWIFEKL